MWDKERKRLRAQGTVQAVVTLKDIAQNLDVSVSTVGRALADHPRISHDTKARVRSVARELGYVADTAARVMRGQRSTLVGLILPDIQNEFYSTVAKAISEYCGEFGFQLALSITNDDPEVELRQIRGLVSTRAAGVVLIPTPSVLRESAALLARQPHVQLIRKCRKLNSAWFGIDDIAAMRDATRHLIDLGHRRIGYIGGSTDISTGAERLDGFRRAMAEAGFDPAESLVETGGCDADYGRLAVGRMLDRRPRPTAIVTAGARITVGVLEGLSGAGAIIPDDMSVIGFSDAPGFAWYGKGLTTIGLPAREIALSCTSFLLRHARENRTATPGQPPHQAIHLPFLVRRGSTATLRR
jgi:LacI family transcriptional regulator